MKCQIDLYAGLLGCGKTTLIKRLLETEYAGKQVAIIENEIGKVNLDAAAFSSENLVVRPLTSGCVCCTVKGDFVEAVNELVREIAPDYIVIEPTGAADIRGLIDACREADAAMLRRLVMIVNARRLLSLLKVVGPFYREQIEAASCIYMNFTETMTEEAKQAAEAAIREINTDAWIVQVPLSEIEMDTFAEANFPEGVFSKSDFPEADSVDFSKISTFETTASETNIIGSNAAEKHRVGSSALTLQSLDDSNDAAGVRTVRMRGFGEQKDVLYTWTMQLEHPLSEIQYEELKNCLRDPAYGDLWRVKGIVPMEDGEKRRLDLTFSDIYESRPEDVSEEICGQIVFIGKRIEVRKFRKYLQELRS